MLLHIFVSFCITFTLIILTYWPFAHPAPKDSLIKDFKPIIVGISFGLTGLILSGISLGYLEGTLINIHIVPLLFSGLIGGPWSMLISGIIMALASLIIIPTQSILSITSLSNINLLIISIGLALFALKKPVTLRTLVVYFYSLTLEITVMLTVVVSLPAMLKLEVIFGFIAYVLITFFTIYIVIKRIQATSEKIQLINRLKEKDYLTQLPNNLAIRSFAQGMALETDNFSVLHFDVDDMKEINIKYGHLAGDEIIKQLATIINNYVEAINGIAARVAGEEFYIILKDAPPAIALYHAEKLRYQIANHAFKIDHGQTTSLTVSIGISSSPDNALEFNELAIIAVQVTTDIKELGGNRVVHANNIEKMNEIST
ncbi:GGDEF domain-containing protein [Lysinibacillus sp. 38-6]|uniref:GGDEF domain-containing protein n=1 Tax=Lysinibacillus sp. 38-6 TaxID=3385991 RepID=UPI0039089C0C